MKNKKKYNKYGRFVDLGKLELFEKASRFWQRPVRRNVWKVGNRMGDAFYIFPLNGVIRLEFERYLNKFNNKECWCIFESNKKYICQITKIEILKMHSYRNGLRIYITGEVIKEYEK